MVMAFYSFTLDQLFSKNFLLSSRHVLKAPHLLFLFIFSCFTCALLNKNDPAQLKNHALHTKAVPNIHVVTKIHLLAHLKTKNACVYTLQYVGTLLSRI